jgi:hypothetical protein
VVYRRLQLDQHVHSREDDLFAAMGPVYFFNSMCALLERRTHTMQWRAADAQCGTHTMQWRAADAQCGMSTSRGNPVRISDVRFKTAAHKAGVRSVFEKSGHAPPHLHSPSCVSLVM